MLKGSEKRGKRPLLVADLYQEEKRGGEENPILFDDSSITKNEKKDAGGKAPAATRRLLRRGRAGNGNAGSRLHPISNKRKTSMGSRGEETESLGGGARRGKKTGLGLTGERRRRVSHRLPLLSRRLLGPRSPKRRGEVKMG